VYDLEEFLSSLQCGAVVSETPLCLVDEVALCQELQGMHLQGHHSDTTMLLELQHRNALLTSWAPSQYNQFRAFVGKSAVAVGNSDDNQQSSSSNKQQKLSLKALWKSIQPARPSPLQQSTQITTQTVPPLDASLHASGLIIYEKNVSVGLVVRACPWLGLKHDMRVTLYPYEMHAVLTTMTFGAFLGTLFPLLKVSKSRLMRAVGSDVAVKYFSHKRSNNTPRGSVMDNRGSEVGGVALQQTVLSSENTPQQVPLSCYQTIGVFSQPAVRVISRLFHEALCHDFVLEVLGDL
jgi:hypothetical protein